MKKDSIKKEFRIFLISVLLLLFYGCKNLHNNSFEAGSRAPDFTFKTTDGETKKLSDLRGNVVVVVLWATWCETCRSEIPALNRLQDEMRAPGVKVLGIVVNDQPGALKDFIQKNPLHYTVGESDEDIASLYKITGVPESFVLDREGRFILLQDPQDGDARVRFLGSRDWSSPLLKSQFEKALLR